MGRRLRFEFTAELWRWESRAELWVFVRLPDDVSEQVRDVPRPRAGFGAVRVLVALGRSRWSTSLFPESTDGPYVLPVRRAVRVAEGVGIGDVVRVRIEMVV